MKALIDIQDDGKIVAVVDNHNTLREAVEKYLRKTGDWDDPEYYWQDDKTSMSGAEFADNPVMTEEFELKTLPEAKFWFALDTVK